MNTMGERQREILIHRSNVPSPGLKSLQNAYARFHGKPEPWMEQAEQAGGSQPTEYRTASSNTTGIGFYSGTGYHPPLRSKKELLNAFVAVFAHIAGRRREHMENLVRWELDRWEEAGDE